MAAIAEKTWECPKCGRGFDKERSRRSHLHWCGRDTSETQRKIGAALRGRKCKPFSVEHRRKMSEAGRGPKNAFYGKQHSAETKQKLRKANLGKHHSAETRRKLSEIGKARPPKSAETRQKLSDAGRGRHPSAETRRKQSEAQRGRKPWNYGKHASAETRRKQSEAQRGSKSHRWKGGPFPYGPTWPEARRIVRGRDGYACQLCGITEQEMGRKLSPHHIRPFRESADNSPENLICLCDTNDNGCHHYCEHHPEDCPEPRKHWLLKVV